MHSPPFLSAGYGCVIEAPPSHPGLMGLVMPWNDALTHRWQFCCLIGFVPYILGRVVPSSLLPIHHVSLSLL